MKLAPAFGRVRCRLRRRCRSVLSPPVLSILALRDLHAVGAARPSTNLGGNKGACDRRPSWSPPSRYRRLPSSRGGPEQIVARRGKKTVGQEGQTTPAWS